MGKSSKTAPKAATKRRKKRSRTKVETPRAPAPKARKAKPSTAGAAKAAKKSTVKGNPATDAPLAQEAVERQSSAAALGAREDDWLLAPVFVANPFFNAGPAALLSEIEALLPAPWDPDAAPDVEPLQTPAPDVAPAPAAPAPLTPLRRARLTVARADLSYLERARRATQEAHQDDEFRPEPATASGKSPRLIVSALVPLLAAGAWIAAQHTGAPPLAPASATAAIPPSTADPAEFHQGAIRLLQDGRASDAAALLRRAAEYGAADSQLALGVLYQNGRGVEADGAEALYWFTLAAYRNNPTAVDRALSLAAQLPPTQVEQARRRAQSFRPRTPLA